MKYLSFDLTEILDKKGYLSKIESTDRYWFNNGNNWYISDASHFRDGMHYMKALNPSDVIELLPGAIFPFEKNTENIYSLHFQKFIANGGTTYYRYEYKKYTGETYLTTETSVSNIYTLELFVKELLTNNIL